MVRNYAAIKLPVAITVISRELRDGDQMPGGTEVPIDKTERGLLILGMVGHRQPSSVKSRAGSRATSYSPRSGAFQIESA